MFYGSETKSLDFLFLFFFFFCLACGCMSVHVHVPVAAVASRIFARQEPSSREVRGNPKSVSVLGFCVSPNENLQIFYQHSTNTGTLQEGAPWTDLVTG